MALVYEKIVGDKTVILEPREACIRIPLASANAWTELRIAVALSLTSTAASNAAYPSESFVASTVYDRYAFGLKNSDTDDLPGVAGTRFWGDLTGNGRTVSIVHTTGAFATGTQAGFTNPVLTVAEGTSIAHDGVNTFSSVKFSTSTETQASTLFANLLGIRLVINNRGLATQTVQMAMGSNHANITDTSEAALRSYLVALSGWSGLTPAVAANSGGVAYAVPDAFFFRLPLITVRARLHNVMVMQAVP